MFFSNFGEPTLLFSVCVCFEQVLLQALHIIIVSSSIVRQMVVCMSRCLTLMLIDLQCVAMYCKTLTFSVSLWQRTIKKELSVLPASGHNWNQYFLNTMSLISKVVMILQAKT